MSPEQNQNLGLDVFKAEAGNKACGEVTAKPIVKTPLMLKVELKFAREGENLGSILKRLYVDENLTLAQIHGVFTTFNEIRIGKTTIRQWMRKLNPEIKIKNVVELYRNPEFNQRRILGMRSFWQDPGKKNQAVAKIHAPEVEEKRRSTVKEFWDKHPELKAEVGKRLKKAREKRYLGFKRKTPKHLLTSLLNQGFKPIEIAQKLDLKPGVVRRLVKDYQLETVKRRTGLSIEELKLRVGKVQRAEGEGLSNYLTPREHEVLRLLYPLSGTPPTRTRVAKDLSVSRENIRQLDKKALKKVDKLLEVGPAALQRKPRRSKK